MPKSGTFTDEEQTATGARKKNRTRRGRRHGEKPVGSAADDEWQRSGAELRAAVMAMEAERAGLPPLPELHTRNLRERMTAMLYLLGASDANLQTLQDTLPPEPAQKGEALSVPPHNEIPEPPAHSGAEFQGAPPATSAAGSSQEYIELPMWGAAASLSYQAAQAGGEGMLNWFARAGRGVGTQASNLARSGGILLAAASQMSPRGAAQTVGATALLAGLSYAWYSMFGRSGDENAAAYERLAELTGMLTEDERALIDSLFPERHAAPVAEPASPFSANEIAELEAIVAELADDDISSEFSSDDIASQPSEGATAMAEESPLAVKSRAERSLPMTESLVAGGTGVKKALVEPSVTTEAASSTNAVVSANVTVPANATSEPESRSAYWAEEYKAAKNGTLEKEIFLMLSEGPKPGDRGSLYVPRESFPLADAWFTRMDELQVGTFRQEFQLEIEEESIASIYDPHSGAKSAELPDERWLHLGRYYLQLYRRALYDWGMGLLHMNVDEARDEEVLVQRLEALTNRLNDDWEGNAMDAGELKEYAAKSKKLAERTTRLVTYSADRPSADIMKNTSWSFSTDIPASEVFFGQYSLSYINLIDRSRFSGTFPQYLKTMLISLVDLIRDDTGHVNLVTLYTAWSLLTVKRLLHALKNDDKLAAYDFAVLDEELNKIIKEHIFLLWDEQTQTKYFELYNESIVEALPLLRVLEARHISETATAQPATVGDTTALPEHALLSGVNWETIRQQAGQAESMPERFSAEKYLLDKLKTKLDRRIADLTGFMGENILHPDRYMAAFVRESLEMYGLEDKWSDQSIITSRPVVLKAGVGMDVGGKLSTTIPSHSYTLVDIARGVPRRDYGTSYTDDVIEWPSSFPSALKENLDEMGEYAYRRVRSEFDPNKPEGGLRAVRVYQFMATRAALAYLSRKNAVPQASRGKNHQRYADAVESYLEGKTKAETVEWHGSTLADVIFIPIPLSDMKGAKTGVFLSLWDNDYYEVPALGLAVKQRKTGLHRNVMPSLIIENINDFQIFMEKHQTVRVGKALASISNRFGYRQDEHDIASQYATFQKQETFTDYHPPVTTTSLSVDDLFDRLISMQRDDLIAAYDELIYSSAEHKRAVAFELINTLAIISGVLLMVGGVMLGGPVLPWVAASLAVTLLGEVVPTAILASLADDKEEQELYIRSMVMAAAFELGGNLVGPAIGGVVKGTQRLARLGNTAVKETLPDLYRVVKEKLMQVMISTGIRRLRKVPETVAAISKEARSDLDKVVEALKKPDSARPSGKAKPPAKTEPVAGSSKQQMDTGAGAAANSTAEKGLLKQSKTAQKVVSKMRNLGFKSDIRILTRWKKGSTTDEITNQYFVQGRRGNDRVVVQMFSENNEFSYIYFDEDEWLRTVIKKSESADAVTGYYDVKSDADFSELFEEFEPMTEAVGNLPLKDYPVDGVLIYTSQQYKNSVKNAGLDFDDVQAFFEKTLGAEKGAETETSLSTAIRQALKENPELHASLKNLPFFADIPFNLSQGDLIMRYAALLQDIGPDITKFRPILQDLALNVRDPTRIKTLTNFYKFELQNSEFQIVAPDILTYKANVGQQWWKKFIPSKNIEKIETAFNKTYTRADQLATLLNQAKTSPALRDGILVVLARYLNTPDAAILGEAYQRLDELSSRLFQQAHYHVKETKLSRVIPVTAREGDSFYKVVAFVYERDPTARIMLVFPTVLEEKGIKNTLLHEMTHHAIGSEDFAYIGELGKKFPNLKQHHFSFGRSQWESFSPHATLGRTAQTSAEYLPDVLPPLNVLDRAIAQARAIFLAMERAYTKMNNADSLVVLINELLSSFKFKWVGDEKTGHWVITVATGSRTRRSTEEEDIYMQELEDDLMALNLEQALNFSVSDIFTDEEIKKFGLELTDSAGTNTTHAITPDA